MTRLPAAFIAVLGLTGHPHFQAAEPKGTHPAAAASKAAHASAPPASVPVVSVRPRAPLPMLPSVARVRVEVARDRLVVEEEVALPRGGWTSGSLDFHAAFGAPGTPTAVDAQLSAEASGANEPPGEAVTVEPEVGAVGGAHPLLGGARMAGVVLRLKETQLRRVYAASDVALLRVRSLLALPSADAEGRREVVVRLGAPEGTPLALGRIQVVSLEPGPWVTRAEASLVGPEADPWQLAVALLPKTASPAQRPAGAQRPIAPVLAVRHASDDLCVRWWSGS
ncbi:MAG: hypothetical protein ACRENE_29995 [Polyangiaceae bacterium]